jgi:hypothetical protein
MSRRERAFTLKMIVDYCKNQVELRQVEGIIKMLNVFLRKDATDEEYELVDSIEKEFRQRQHGNTFNGPVGQVLQHVERLANQKE